MYSCGFLRLSKKPFCEENFEGRLQGFPEANLRALGVPRQGVSRNGADGVVTYSEASTGVTTQYSPKLFRKTLRGEF